MPLCDLRYPEWSFGLVQIPQDAPTPLTTEAVKFLLDEIERLKARVAELESKLESEDW